MENSTNTTKSNTKADLDKREKEINIKKISDELLIDKVVVLYTMLELTVVDKDRTILGSDPFFKRVFNDNEISIMKKKIFELVNKF